MQIYARRFGGQELFRTFVGADRKNYGGEQQGET